jgi:hypothetical protein
MSYSDVFHELVHCKKTVPKIEPKLIAIDPRFDKLLTALQIAAPHEHLESQKLGRISISTTLWQHLGMLDNFQ